MKIEDQKSGEYRFSSTYQFFIDYIDYQCSLRMADVSPHSSPLRDVSRGGTSATQRQKFHTDDAKSVWNPVRSAHWSTE